MSEPDLYQEHVSNLFSEPEGADTGEVISQEPESGPETAVDDSAAAATDSAGAPAEPEAGLDWRTVAQGRLREINAIRARHAETRERMEALEKQFLALRARLEPGDELPPELLEADPALKYVTGKLKTIEDRLAGNQQAQQEQVQFQRETADTVRYAQESRQAFLQHTPDWEQAYQYLRQRFAEANGKTASPDRDEWLNVQEHIAVNQWRQDGEDPALKIYEMAMANGWRPGALAPTAPQPQPSPANGNGRIRRVRDAVAAPSPSSLGRRDMGADVMSREQFYEQFPQNERIRIFNSDRGEDIFESLMKEGRIPVSMLPRSS